ncbi:hypothetical protein [Bordetella genomosp. 9]|uniref:hypothetical protein n=1 Tax=Bordetella genomosp. 9 TaxID=1416803 RepID=UPI0012FB32CB|nr:hypothetical protein [Bordetella genomosp. 9]
MKRRQKKEATLRFDSLKKLLHNLVSLLLTQQRRKRRDGNEATARQAKATRQADAVK